MAGPLSLLSGAPVIIARKEGADRPSAAASTRTSHHQHVSRFLLDTLASPPSSSKEAAALSPLVAPQHAALHSKKTLPALRADHARAQTAAVIVSKVRQLRPLLTRSRLSHYSQSEVRDTPTTIPKASNVSRIKLCANRARALRIILPPRALGQALGKPISAPGHWLSHARPPPLSLPAQ
ncbi:hypothetical protein COCC4DRAFT_57142 [Bipolaris maydis ATCC 48331]|uniref:Uncharacterized protein n=2 Tax=Cochliobolus heterostrophus TaxID=5016 RepID=M2UVJ0_COCH5|nr:uncharacterized protein COCC4DRAFT_57142 [Bipolaris maydis ATCC 48331]EMD91838.1 hypothetical protein COCHEDRAFT_1156173 [Bipolaris maydis C5]ENI08404.1 hypothetical protein COCC4DRAFT_57142 [Bipolaris maydis ATCC 48331]